MAVVLTVSRRQFLEVRTQPSSFPISLINQVQLFGGLAGNLAEI